VAPGATAPATNPEAIGGVAGGRAQSGTAGTVPGNLDGARDQQLAAVATARPTGRRVVPGPVRNDGLVGFDQSCQGVALGSDHRPAELGAPQPGRLVGAETQLLAHLPRREAVLVVAISRPPRSEIVGSAA
jgi:hypothetical protein